MFRPIWKLASVSTGCLYAAVYVHNSPGGWAAIPSTEVGFSCFGEFNTLSKHTVNIEPAEGALSGS